MFLTHTANMVTPAARMRARLRKESLARGRRQIEQINHCASLGHAQTPNRVAVDVVAAQRRGEQRVCLAREALI